MVVGGGAGWCVVAATTGAAGAVVAGAGAGAGLPEVDSAVVAVGAGVVVFGWPMPTATAIAVPPQHSTRRAARIARISGVLDFFPAAGTVWAGICSESGAWLPGPYTGCRPGWYAPDCGS